MKIYTSYFGNLKKLAKEGIKPVAISLYPPKWYSGAKIGILAPQRPLLKMQEKEYTVAFKEMLSTITTEQIEFVLKQQDEGKPIALLCYEVPTDFCHRHLVAKWLNKKYGLNVTEFVPKESPKNQTPVEQPKLF